MALSRATCEPKVCPLKVSNSSFSLCTTAASAFVTKSCWLSLFCVFPLISCWAICNWAPLTPKHCVLFTAMDSRASWAYSMMMLLFQRPRYPTWDTAHPFLMYCKAPLLRVEWPVTSLPYNFLQSWTMSALVARRPFLPIAMAPNGVPLSVAWFTKVSSTAYGHLRSQPFSHKHWRVREMPKPSVSFLDSLHRMVTNRLVQSNLMSSVLRFESSISRIIQCTPQANSSAEWRTFMPGMDGSSNNEWSVHIASGTSAAFFRGPVPRLAAAMQSLKWRSSKLVHGWPASTCSSLASMR